MTETRNTPGSIENIALAALSSLQTCRSTYAVCRQALEEGIPGDFVECGVYAGSQAAVMAKALAWEEQKFINSVAAIGSYATMPLDRHVHLFDSFQGIPEPTERDKEYIASGHRKGTAACTLEGVKSNMKQWGIPDELLYYYPGWFTDTVPSFAIVANAIRESNIPDDSNRTAIEYNPIRLTPLRLGMIAVLRLDADLYESTLTCLEYLYPLLSPGGFLIVDDYGLSGARQAVNDYMLEKGGGFPPMYFRKP